MNYRSFLIIVLILAASCAKQQQDPEQVLPDIQLHSSTLDSRAAEPGIAYIKLTESLASMVEEDLEAGLVQTKSEGLNTVFRDLGVVSMRRLFPHAGEFEPRTRREGLHLWYKVEYDTNQPQTKAEASLSSLEGIQLVEVKNRIRNTAIFNDPQLSYQWHYINNSHIDINVEKVWQYYTTGSSRVIVSVVDGGIDLNHEDLAPNTIPGGPDGSYNAVDDNYVIAADGHGTHVAGTIAAVNNNGVGVCGIAGGNAAEGIEGVKVMSCMIFRDEGDKTLGGDSGAAIKWGADHGAVISQNSWGYVVDVDEDGKISDEELERAKHLTISNYEKEAVDYFIKYAGCDNDGNQLPSSPMKGGVVVFAAGNDALEYGAPANYSPIIAVGAMNSDGARASFSNYGSWVDIAAPGANIRSTVPTNSYATYQGTSMACPHVSGVAALLVSYFGGPGFTADKLKEYLLEGANPTMLPYNAHIGPMLDAYGSFSYDESNAPEAVSTFEVSAYANNLEFSWQVTGNKADIPAAGYVLLASQEPLSGLDPAHPGENVFFQKIALDNVQTGDTVTGRLEDLDFDTDYYVAIAGYDYKSHYSALSGEKTIRTLQNNPPVISSSYTGGFSVHAHETLYIPFQVVDPDGHRIKIEYIPGSNADNWAATDKSGNYQIIIDGNAVKAGSYTASITATDSYGMSDHTEVTYTILENHAPVTVEEIGNRMYGETGFRFDLDMARYISDPDGETLVYTVDFSDKTIVNFNQQGNILYGTTLKYGLTDVTITGTDVKGLTASQSFKVLVRDPSIQCTTYPNPVVDVLYITNSEDPAVSTDVRILSATGKTVYEGTLMVGAFQPATIDMSACAPGRYTVSISYGGKQFIQNIVK